MHFYFLLFIVCLSIKWLECLFSCSLSIGQSSAKVYVLLYVLRDWNLNLWYFFVNLMIFWFVSFFGGFAHSRIFHSFGEITITGEFFTYTRHTWPLSSEDFLTCIFNLPDLLWHGPTLYNGHLRAPVTLTPCSQVFGSGTVTTCFNDLGLSWPGLELQSPACEENSTYLSRWSGIVYEKQFQCWISENVTKNI